jgi:hypothetical protein
MIQMLTLLEETAGRPLVFLKKMAAEKRNSAAGLLSNIQPLTRLTRFEVVRNT